MELGIDQAKESFRCKLVSLAHGLKELGDFAGRV
jgi:hypothetical protein